MFKKIVFYIGFSILSLSIYAQNFGGGIIGGIDGSQISGDGLAGFNRLGITFGGYITFPHQGKSSIRMELNYIQKGSRTNFTFTKDSVPYDGSEHHIYHLNLHYVEIPFLYLYELNKRITLEAGFSAGVFISSYEEYDGYDITHVDNRPNFKPYDLSFALGLYYQISDKFSINARFSNSFLPVRAHYEGATYVNLSNILSPTINMGQYNSVLQFTLNYKIK
ncbi:MAG: porin family protein [Bacteroidota bacterium]|nr:porin family protein [Bacteroidota bacterium]